MRINNNLLLWSSVSDPSRDRVDSFPATLGCRSNPGEVDRWAGAAFLGMASLTIPTALTNLEGSSPKTRITDHICDNFGNGFRRERPGI